VATPEELLAVPPPLKLGEISQESPYMLTETGPMLPAPQPVAPQRSSEERILAAVGGEEALQVPPEMQTGAPAPVRVPAEFVGAPRMAAAPEGLQVMPYTRKRELAGPLGAAVGPAAPMGPESPVVAQARQLLGDQGADLVQQLQAQGVPDAAILSRLGLRPGGGMGGGGFRQDPTKGLPPELRVMNPAPGLYMPGYRAALHGADIDPKAKEQLLARYDEWARTDPRAVELMQHEMGLEFAEKERGFQQRQQEAEQRQLEAQREIETQRAEKAQMDAAQFQDFKANFDRRYGEIEREYTATIEQLKRTKVDPRRGSVPILDALAVALGAAGAAFTKGPNFAQQIISQRVNNDIQAQLADIANLKDTAAAQRNRLGMLREQLGDEQAAILFEQKLQLDAAKAYLGQRKAETGSELARVDAERYEAEVDRAISQNQA